MTAAEYNLRVQQGATFRIVMGFQNGDEEAIDVRNNTFSASIKRKYDDTAALVSFTISSIGSGTEHNEIVLSLTATQTALLPTVKAIGAKKTETELCWDLLWTDLTGFVKRPVEGIVYVSPRVTT